MGGFYQYLRFDFYGVLCYSLITERNNTVEAWQVSG